MNLSGKRLLSLVSLLIFVGFVVGCSSKRRTGTVLGTAAGGVLGELIDDEGEEGLIIGAVAGGALGYYLGKQMEKSDHRKFERAMENNEDNETSRWTNQNTGNRYAVTPTSLYHDNSDRICRDFTMSIQGNKTETTKGTTCQTGDGKWKVIEGESADRAS